MTLENEDLIEDTDCFDSRLNCYKLLPIIF